MTGSPDVVIVGMGYVGLTIASTLASLDINVWGYERQPEIVSQLNKGHSHLYEPGIDEILQSKIGKNLVVEGHLPESFGGIFILCVSTPIGPDKSPDLRNLRAASTSVAECAEEGAMVIVRSTVPVGTCRTVVLPALQEKMPSVQLASCPERTIQGQALTELRNLPQVVAGLDEASTNRAKKLWEQVTQQVITVSSLEAAEMVKLINNSHTDLLYSFGNEIAFMAQGLDLDPMEVIHAANVDYPRPNLARPGFVGGPCISKDPYILLDSVKDTGYTPQLVAGARELNESLPQSVAKHFIDRLKACAGDDLTGSKILVCGFAYKGWPVTDDTRDAPADPILRYFKKHSLQIFGHDPMVPAERIKASGATPVKDVSSGFDGSTGVLFINEHPDYRQLEIGKLVKSMKSPAAVYDCWRMFDRESVEVVPGIRYSGIGYG